jgi:peroxiredoxin
MKLVKNAILSLTAAALCTGGAFAGTDPKSENAEVGKPAPDFKLTSTDGQEFTLSELKGKVVVLQWTNHTCPFIKFHESKEKTPQKLMKQFEGKDVVWITVDSSNFAEEQKESINEFRTENDILYPTLLDAEGKVGRMYGAKSTPHVFVIDQKGVLVYDGAMDDDAKLSGDAERNYVAEAVSATLAGSTVPISKTKSYGCSVKYKQ